MSKALRFHSFGSPEEVLVLEEVPDAPAGPGEVLIGMLASPINPSDIGSILGKYGQLKELPAVAGMDGIGQILDLGPEVTHLRTGQWVRFPEDAGVWQESCVVQGEQLRPLPDGLPLETTALAFVNPPTAIRLIEDFVPLQPGDWVIQNGANSNLGIAIIQYARRRGIKTINVVRRDSLKAPLRELGADVVVTEDEPYAKNIRDLSDGEGLRLALNSVGGASALNLLNALNKGGTHVTYGAMTFESIRFPTRQLIFQQVEIRGFWLHEWIRTHSEEERCALEEQVVSLIADGTFRFPIERTYRLSEFRDALAHQQEPRLGKILLTP